MSDYFARALRADTGDSAPNFQQVQAPEGSGDYFSRALRSGGQAMSTPQSSPDRTATSSTAIDFDRSIDEVRADIAKLPERDREAALRQWADQYVARERSGGGVMRGVTDTVRNFARGTPVGSWLDEANAATAGALHRVTGGAAGAPYDEAVAYQRATDRAVDRESTKLGKLSIPLVGEVDVTAGDLTKVAGGIASFPAFPAATVMRGTSMMPQIANATATGVGYGALYGSGQGEGAQNRLWEAGKGAAIGGAIGPAAIPIAQGIGAGITAIGNRLTPLPAGIRGYERGAVNRVARAVADDDLAATYGRQAAELGPEGMLADMGHNLRGQAGAIANQPGRGQQMVSDALHSRREGAAGRIASDVDQALGPAANIPETLHATQRHYRQQAAPHRQQFQQSPVPFTQDLDDTLRLLVQNEPGVIREARRYANIDPAAGPDQFFARQMPDGSFQVTRVPNATEWDYLKRALDGMGGRTATPNDQRIYGSLASRLRTQVDEALSPGAPDQSPWARARALEAEDFQIRDAMEAGRGAFNRNLTPDQMRAELYGVGQPPRGGMTPPELAGYGVGARDQVRTIMGTAATAHGENAAAGARRALGSDYAREKLDIIAGPQASGQLTRRLDAETVFDQTRQAVTQNSATARRLAAQEEFPGPTAKSDRLRGASQVTTPGVVLGAGARLVNALTNGAINERRLRIARDAAEMLVAQGQARDNVANALFAVSQHQGFNQAARRAIARLAMQIAEGSRQKAIESAGPKQGPPAKQQPARRNTLTQLPGGRNALMPPAEYLLPSPQ